LSSAGRTALVIVATAASVVGAYRAGHTVARRSPTARAWLLGGNLAAVSAGLVAALWLPHRVPDTGSAATMVAVVLLWIIGGGLALLGAASFLGAITARPRRSGPGRVGS
jgi:predicted outer membrane lipoprotein